jgi:hypothetical protein
MSSYQTNLPDPGIAVSPLVGSVVDRLIGERQDIIVTFVSAGPVISRCSIRMAIIAAHRRSRFEVLHTERFDMKRIAASDQRNEPSEVAVFDRPTQRECNAPEPRLRKATGFYPEMAGATLLPRSVRATARIRRGGARSPSCSFRCGPSASGRESSMCR